MKRLVRSICGLLWFGICLALEHDEQQDWVEYQLGRIEAMPADPSLEDVVLLAKLAYPDPEGIRSETQIVRETAKDRLWRIPDFPSRLNGYIQNERRKWKEGGWEGAYDREMMWAFPVMGRIHHPEIVRVIGEYLYDEEPEEKPFDAGADSSEFSFHRPACLYALGALQNLIANPPEGDGTKNWTSAIPVWRLWYEQVKAGNRTFRFKGDTQHYTLQGPVGRAREPLTSRPAKPGLVVKEGATAEKEIPNERHAPWGLLLGAVVVCGVAVWAVLKTRRLPVG